MPVSIDYLASGLPDNADLAILELRNRVAIIISENDFDAQYDAPVIMAVLDAWYEKHTSSTAWSRPEFTSGVSDIDKLRAIIKSIDAYEITVKRQVASETARRIFDVEEQIKTKSTFGIALLSKDDKNKIREHICNIRQLINESALAERKKLRFCQNYRN